jgi:hypothetical protein
MPTKVIAVQAAKRTVSGAKPTVDRLRKDEKFKKHVKGAYGSARTIYDELFEEGAVPTQAQAKRIVAKLAEDPELQNELRNVFTELRSAGKRARKPESHKKRNAAILAGIIIGVMYNPKTGPETRRWLKDRIFGPEETFEFET